MFPVILHFGAYAIHAHTVLELAAYAVAFRLMWRARRSSGDVIGSFERWAVIAAAILGAGIGSHVLGWLEAGVHSGLPGWMTKTIVGALLGGWIAVEGVKRGLGIRTRTGDLFAIPIAVGILIGRLGCFLEGLPDDTVGSPTTLPWGMDFGDGIPRHPAPLYEMLWMALVLAWLLWRRRRPHASGSLFREFLAAYLGFRWFAEFLKPGTPWWGLTAIQWACVLGLVALLPSSWWRRWSPVSRRPVGENVPRDDEDRASLPSFAGPPPQGGRNYSGVLHG